jgi:hypothetical protein
MAEDKKERYLSGTTFYSSVKIRASQNKFRKGPILKWPQILVLLVAPPPPHKKAQKYLASLQASRSERRH